MATGGRRPDLLPSEPSGCLFAFVAWMVAIAVLRPERKPRRQDEVPPFQLTIYTILVVLATLWLLGILP